MRHRLKNYLTVHLDFCILSCCCYIKGIESTCTSYLYTSMFTCLCWSLCQVLYSQTPSVHCRQVNIFPFLGLCFYQHFWHRLVLLLLYIVESKLKKGVFIKFLQKNYEFRHPQMKRQALTVLLHFIFINFCCTIMVLNDFLALCDVRAHSKKRICSLFFFNNI